MFEPEFPIDLKKRIANLESEISLYRVFLRESHKRELMFKQNADTYLLLLIAARQQIREMRSEEFSV